MGLNLFLEDDVPETISRSDYPRYWTRTDGRGLLHYIWGHSDILLIPWLEARLDLDLSLMSRVATDDLPLEEWIDMYGDDAAGRQTIAEERAKRAAYNDAAWTTPQAMFACVQALIRALDSDPEILMDLEMAHATPPGYFINPNTGTNSLFLSDLDDLLRKVSWAKEHGATRVRPHAW